MFKYLACPNEKACGTKNIYPSIDGTIIIREIEKYNAQMVMNDVCSFIIYAPPEMQMLDRLLVQIDKIENSDIYVAKAKGFKWISHLDRIASNDQIFDTRMGWQIYVVGVGNSMFKGTFRLKIWVEKGTGEPLIIEN
jgi:hypothetical protein